MRLPLLHRLILGLALLAIPSVSLSAPPDSPDLPTKGLSAYDTYRSALLESGWNPVAQDAKAAIYGYPEVVCGNALCEAHWVGPYEIELILWRADRLVLAPAH